MTGKDGMQSLSYDYWIDVVITSYYKYLDYETNKSPLDYFNPLRPRQNGRFSPGDIFKWIFLNENAWISIKMSLNFGFDSPINNIPVLAQIMIIWSNDGQVHWCT